MNSELRRPFELQIAIESCNQEVREAIERLNVDPDIQNRRAFYGSLTKGTLILVSKSPLGLLHGQPVRLTNDKEASFLCTESPGGKPALVAFTDFDALRKRSEASDYVCMQSRDVLKLVLDFQLDGLIINPAGPWAGVPREDVSRILEGAI